MIEPSAAIAADSPALLRASHVPMLLVDVERAAIVDSNDAAAGLYGLPATAMAGMALATLDADGSGRTIAAVASAASRPGVTALEQRDATGRVIPVTLTAWAVDGPGGPLVCAAITARDPGSGAETVLAQLHEATVEIARAILRATDEPGLWAEACRIVVDIGGFRLAWIAEVDDARGLVVPATAAGAGDVLDGREDALGVDAPTPIAIAVREARTVVADDIATSGIGPLGDRAAERGFNSGCAVPLRDGDGRPFGVLVVLEDRAGVLDPRRVALLERLAADLGVARVLLEATERLRRSEERHRELVEHATAGIVTLDASGRVLDANPAMCAMVGYGLDELRALGSSFIVMDYPREDEELMLDLLQSGEMLEVDRHLRRSDGETITAAFHCRLQDTGVLEAVVQEVTAERRANAALRLSEARHRDLVAALQEGIIAYDASGRVTEINDAALRMMGIRASVALGTDGADLARTFVDEDGDPFPADRLPSRVALRSARPTDRVVVGMPHDDGTVRWVSSNAVPMTADADGRPIGVVVSFTDVTDLREAIARATTSEAKVRSLVESATEAVLVMDTGGLITYANPVAERLFGVGSRELAGRPLEDFVPKHARRRFLAAFARLVRGEHFAGEFPGRRADGTEVLVEVSAAGLPDGGIECIARDITERRALEGERDRLALAAEQASDAIYVTDLEDRIVYVNRAYERLTGYLRDEVIGKTTEVHRGPGETVADVGVEALLASGGSRAGEITMRTKGGRRLRVSRRLVVLRDRDGQASGALGIARDISVERDEDARLANAARTEAVAQLAGGVAHDLNNVLTMIVGYATLLEPGTATPDEIADSVRGITEATDQAQALTTRLLAFGRRTFLHPRAADLRDLLADMQPILARAAGPRSALLVSPGTVPVPVRIDPNLFEQAILNLVTNARDAMPGGGSVRLSIEPPEADDGLPPTGWTTLVVADTGSGIPPEMLAHVFEPSYGRGGDERVGLGLAMVHGVVEQSGGRIRVLSELGAGTTFRISLPLNREAVAEEPASPAARSQPRRSGPATILVAEDELVLRQVAQRTLESAGYRVMLAASGEEALLVAASYPDRIDVLFADVVMPGLRGPGLAAALLRLRPDTRVLLTSGYAEDDIVRRGITSATGEFLAKPYAPAGLLRAVERLLA